MDDASTEIVPAIQRALCHGAPCFIEWVTLGEHEVIPPVAEWQRMAREVARPIAHRATRVRGQKAV